MLYLLGTLIGVGIIVYYNLSKPYSDTAVYIYEDNQLGIEKIENSFTYTPSEK